MPRYRQYFSFALISAVLGTCAVFAPANSSNISNGQPLPISGRPSPDARVGIDVDDLLTSSDVIFSDVMKQATPWTSAGNIVVGDDGNVRKLAPKQFAQTVILQSAVYPAGDYSLLWDGSGSFAIDSRSGTITHLSNGRAIVHVSPPTGYGIRLRLIATDSKNYVRNIRLLLPQYAASGRTSVFSGAFLARLARLNVLRFVNWSHADRLQVSATWPSRPVVTRFTQAGPAGVALEYQIALANAVGADPWFAVPAGATNFYMTQMAALVQARLDPRLRPSFEYAPGAWRLGSAANAYAIMAGRNFRLSSDSQTAAVLWYARRSAQMFAMVREVYGPDAVRITRVLSGPVALGNTAAESIDRMILTTARAANGPADEFAVDISTAVGQAIPYTRALVSAFGPRLTAIGAGALLTGTSGAQVMRGQLDAWHQTAGGLVIGSALPAYPAAAQKAAFTSYASVYPSYHLAPAPQAASVAPAPESFATTYVPSAAAAPAVAAEAAATRAHAAAVQAANAALGIDINCGGSSTGSWVSDIDFSGGSVSSGTNATIDTSGVDNPAPQSVYQTGRFGASFSYLIPGLTASAPYTVRLHLVEYIYGSAGQRIGNYSINGSPVLTNFDIYAAANGRNKAIVKQFTVNASTSGTISIAVTGVQADATNHAIVSGIEIIAAGSTPPPTSGDVLQFHNDNMRTGWNRTESKLTTTTVATSQFGLRQTLNVDGLVLAQPLYVANYPVAADGGRNHNLLIVATENNTIYAFDADSGAVLWQRNYGTAQSSSKNDINCADIVPSYGINSTPVIDRNAGTIYAVVSSEPSSNVYHTDLHAINLGTGADKIAAARITASRVMSNGSTMSYNPATNMQRASLLLANNSLYLGFGSHCDHSESLVSGWLMRYSASSLQQLAAFNTIEDSVSAGTTELGSIWGGGFGPAADTQGNIYAVTGNGAFDASSAGHNFAMSVLRFAPDLSGGVRDWFAYSGEANDSSYDRDFGSGGAMLLPTQSFGVPNTLVAMGKSSALYLLNQQNLGHYSSTNSGALSIRYPGGSGVWGGPAFFQAPAGPTVYYQTDQNVLKAYTVSANGASSQILVTSTGDSKSGYGGSTPVVSSNGNAAGSGIVWTLRRVHYGGTTPSTTTLDAYDATNVAHHLFAAKAGTWSTADDNEFVSPLVANGKVYVGAYKTVTVFGLAP